MRAVMGIGARLATPPPVVQPAPMPPPPVVTPSRLTVHDIRAQLPRANPQNLTRRSLSAIKLFGWHWDGGPPIPAGYDPLSYYQGEAEFHINKDWGGGSYGTGLMYHGKLSRDGTLWLTRDLEDAIWAAMNANPIGMWVCVDATDGSPLTAAQKAALPLVEAYFMGLIGRDVPVTMHGLLVSYGNSTSCAGPDILAYLKATGRAQLR